jgi:hypothetical protein
VTPSSTFFLRVGGSDVGWLLSHEREWGRREETSIMQEMSTVSWVLLSPSLSEEHMGLREMSS